MKFRINDRIESNHPPYPRGTVRHIDGTDISVTYDGWSQTCVVQPYEITKLRKVVSQNA